MHAARHGVFAAPSTRSGAAKWSMGCKYSSGGVIFKIFFLKKRLIFFKKMPGVGKAPADEQKSSQAACAAKGSIE
jgi:hypothetical protein